MSPAFRVPDPKEKPNQEPVICSVALLHPLTPSLLLASWDGWITIMNCQNTGAAGRSIFCCILLNNCMKQLLLSKHCFIKNSLTLYELSEQSILKILSPVASLVHDVLYNKDYCLSGWNINNVLLDHFLHHIFQ